MNRLRSGFVLSANPFNLRQVSRVPLSPAWVDMIVFWSKQPEPMLKHLDELDDMGYVYYFQYTLNGLWRPGSARWSEESTPSWR